MKGRRKGNGILSEGEKLYIKAPAYIMEYHMRKNCRKGAVMKPPMGIWGRIPRAYVTSTDY
jgi:hypothetical protein